MVNKNIRFASQTLAAIDAALEADQGNRYRQHLQEVLPHIGDIYRQQDDSFRSHLGASMLGRDCARELWYGFRWFTAKRSEGRMVRLFNRGHMEEARFIALLLMINVKVYQQDENGNQFRISRCGGHIGGSGDGVGIGIPDLEPSQPCLLEFKTHNQKSFDKLAEEGVRGAKPEHFVQMQQYMQEMRIPVTLYGAVCKNTDHLHLELVIQNGNTAEDFFKRGEEIVFSPTPPKKLNESVGFWKCRFCDQKSVCHLKAPAAVNCRTCVSSKPLPSGEWVCNMHGHFLSKEDQLKACSEYQSLT